MNREIGFEEFATQQKLSESGRTFLEGYPIERVEAIWSGPESQDLMEERYANQLLKKLPKIVKRASSLDEIGPEEIQKCLIGDEVRKYWEEAHRCYLYGFDVACAVLCRAILESALVEVIDPKGDIERKIEDRRRASQERISYIAELIREAERQGILTADRPACADEVREAGNEAIHDHTKFQRRLEGPDGLGKIVLDTRKILLDLYSQ